MTLKIGTLEADITGNTSGLKAAEQETKRATTNISNNLKNSEKAAIATGKAVDDMGRRVGQIGIQVGQFAGQIQGGQSALLAFSQQAADIGFFLGPQGMIVGGIIGVVSAIAGSLLPSLFKSKDAMSELEDAMKSLSDTAITSTSGVEVLTKEIADLAKESEAAARTVIRGGIIDGMDAIKAAGEGVIDVLGDKLKRVLNVTGNAKRSLGKTTDRLAESLGITKDQLMELVSAFKELEKNRSAENIEKVQQAVDKIAQSGGNAEFVKIANSLREYSDSSADAAEKVKVLEAALTDLGSAVKTSEEELSKSNLAQSVIDRRIEELRRLGESEREEIQRQYEERRAFILEQEQLTEDERSALILKSAEDRQRQLDEINKRELDAEQKKNDEKLRMQQQSFNTQVAAMSNMTNAIGNLLSTSGEDSTAKFAAIVQNIAAITTQIATLMQAQATAQAAADPTAVTVPQKIANVAAMVSMFASIFATISKARGAGRQHGGNVSPGLAHPINEQGIPEILSQGGKQYLLPTGQGGTITPMKQGGAGTASVTIINNGEPMKVDRVEQSEGSMKVYVDNQIKRMENKIYSSASSGRGDFANNLSQGYDVKRRL